jgi:DNA-binding transcriptional ArsR family regulator
VPDLLAILQSPRRREILRLCWDDAVPAGRIRDALPDVTFGAVSQHLAVLRDAGFVNVRRAGNQRYYRTDRHALGPLAQALEAMWSSSLDRLAAAVEADPNPQPRKGR